MNETYSPMSAIVFAKMFEDNSSRGLAKTLINVVLRDLGYDEIEKVVEVKSEYSLIGGIDGTTGKINKGGRLDVKALDAKKNIYNIEVQIEVEPNMNDRSIFYISKLISDKTEAGTEFSKIPRVIAINFLKHGVRKDNLTYHNVAGVIYDDSKLDIKDLKSYEWASDKIEIHNIEMDVFERTQGKCRSEDLSELGVWLRYMQSGYKNKEEGEQLMKIAKNLVEYSEMYNVAVNDPEIKRRYDFYMSGVMDEASRIGRAKRQGESIGLAKGESIGLAKGETIGLEKGKNIGKLEGLAKGKDIGKLEGLAEGKDIGKLEGKLEVAAKLKSKGLADEFIAETLELPLDTVGKL